MGALAAVVDKRGRNVASLAIAMLDALSHRGSDAYGLASSHEAAIASSTSELRKADVNANGLVGYNLAKILPHDEAQPLQEGDSALAFDGRIFPAPEEGKIQYARQKLKDNSNNAKQLIRSAEGGYAFALAKKNKIVVGRDALGTCPLYFGENETLCAIASERKALWTIGLLVTDSFSPGTVAVVDETGFQFRPAKALAEPPIQEFAMNAAAEQLEQKICQSVKKRVTDVEEVAVAFSGGIDSSLVAFLANRSAVNTHLIYVALSHQQEETAFAEKAAAALGLDFHPITFSLEDLQKDLPTVLWLIEDPNPVNVSIAIPIYWAAEQSARRGLRVMLSGQGGDELFGGYHRYLADYSQRGRDGLQETLYQDVVSSYKTNFERDDKACAFHKVELRMPLVDWNVVQLALRIPPRLKIQSPHDLLRKRVLRQTAKRLGVPKLISEKPKRAIQYSTGVNHGLRTLAKTEGLTLRKYIEDIFLKTFKMLN